MAKKQIGKGNRLDIVVQAILDYRAEGGLVIISKIGNKAIISLKDVVYDDGRLIPLLDGTQK